MSIQFQCYPLNAPDEIESKWRNLEERARENFMLSWSWIGPWLRVNRIDAFVVEGRIGQETVALGILIPSSTRRWGLFHCRQVSLHRTGDPMRDQIAMEYNGLLCDRRHEDETVGDFLDFLVTAEKRGDPPGEWDQIEIAVVPNAQLKRYRGHGLTRRVISEAMSYAVDLEALRRSGKRYLQTLSRNTRAQIRKSMRLYEEHGPLNMQRPSTVEDALSFFQDAGAMHTRRWSPHDPVSAFDNPNFVEFHEDLIQNAWPRGEIDISRISAGDHLVGILYNFVCAGHVYFYLSALRYEQNPRLKPGLVCHALTIQHHCDAGQSVYDFMAGTSRYKASLGAETEPMTGLLLRQPRMIFRVENLFRSMHG